MAPTTGNWPHEHGLEAALAGEGRFGNLDLSLRRDFYGDVRWE